MRLGVRGVRGDVTGGEVNDVMYRPLHENLDQIWCVILWLLSRPKNDVYTVCIDHDSP